MQSFSLVFQQLNFRSSSLFQRLKPLLLVRHSGHKIPIASFSQNVSAKNQFLKVSLPGLTQPLELHRFWLRDHCRCPSCYNSITCQRNVDIVEIIRDDLAIGKHELNGDRLDVTWSDGHQSSYSLAWLKNNTYEGRRKLQNQDRKRVLWNRSTVNQLNLEPIVESQLRNDETIREVYQRLFRYGFVKIEQVPVNRESTLAVAEKIFYRVSNTVFGNGLWEIGNNFDHKDTGYTNASLELHTDTTYFTEAVGNLVFHCLEYNGTGGESIYVDGFYVAKLLKERDPEAYDFLSRTVIESEYIEPDHHFIGKGPCLIHHPVSGELEQIRLNPLDRAPLDTLPQTQVEQYYRHLKSLLSIIKEKENEFVIRQSPGTVLIIDNYRLLHGRNAYQGTRVMAGCYISRSDFVSRAKTFGIELSA